MAAVMILVAAGAAIFSSSTRSSLDQYKAGLRAKGEKLQVTELAVALSTNAEEIACRNIFATNICPTPKLVPSIMSFAGPGKARVAWKNELKVDNAKGTWEELEAQVAAAEPSLRLFRQGLEHPAPDSGWAYRNDFESNRKGPKLNYVMKRTVAQSLMGAEICALHRGDFDEAFKNLHALANLARLEKNDLPLAWGMVRVAIAGVGLAATWEALQAPGWDETRLAQLQRDWEQFNALDALERGVLGERAMNQSIMAWVRTASSKDFAGLIGGVVKSSGMAVKQSGWTFRSFWKNQVLHTAYKVGGINADELAQLDYYASILTGIRQLQANQGYAQVGNSASNAGAMLDKKMQADHWHRLKMSAIIVPNLSRGTQTAVENETLRRLTIAALAIKRYELKHGAPPAELEALTPELLAAVPLDPMSGKPLCYRLNADRTFVLYSTGEDGKDDGGDATPVKTVVTSSWIGRDAVWPTAVTGEEPVGMIRTQAKLEK